MYEPECLIKNDLVYVVNYKCASTFFYNNFSNNFGWEPILWKDVDFQKHHVFGHILDPILKQAKGKAEFLQMHNMCDWFYDDPNIQVLILYSMFPDPHSFSYYMLFKEKMWHIDWIPLLKSHEENLKVTNVFLRSHGENYLNWDMSLVHEGSKKKSECATAIKKLLTNEQLRHQLNDEIIWNRLYYLFKDPLWPECRWTKDFSNLPMHVREELLSNKWVTDQFIISDDLTTLSLINDKTINPLVRKFLPDYLGADQELYSKVVENFNFDEREWSKISWLTSS